METGTESLPRTDRKRGGEREKKRGGNSGRARVKSSEQKEVRVREGRVSEG